MALCSAHYACNSDEYCDARSECWDRSRRFLMSDSKNTRSCPYECGYSFSHSACGSGPSSILRRLAQLWLDCCDPKAGAIAALTMGCFFAFVGALFSAAWIFKCWCFKKPDALMLQAMANQQQYHRAMAAGHMQSPVVVQMQAPPVAVGK